MPYNVLMPEEKQKSLRPRWVPLWQRRWWIGLGLLFILVWLVVPPWLYRHTGTAKDAKLKAITDTRTALLAGLIGVGALLTFWLNRQGQITDRYTKAIEQLGSDKLDVRLGGIYALERIAADSQRDHPTVVEVLSAFVREHSHPTQTTAPDGVVAEVLAALLRGRSEPAEVTQSSSDRSGNSGPNESALSLKPTTDVQAALTVLGRLPQRSGVSRGDLAHALLVGALFRGANLSGARLGGANLSDAHLDEVDLSGAVLFKTDLSGAILSLAKLTDARLVEANLSGAALIRANLSGARLDEADLSGATLFTANLSNARLDRASLSDAELTDADLSGARLYGADLRETTGLTQEQLNSAYGNANTQLPDGLQRPDGWKP
jgi:uncharacterized protein YjbI with pentapeptide repeats